MDSQIGPELVLDWQIDPGFELSWKIGAVSAFSLCQSGHGKSFVVETLRSVHIAHLFPGHLRKCPPIGSRLASDCHGLAGCVPIQRQSV